MTCIEAQFRSKFPIYWFKTVLYRLHFNLHLLSVAGPKIMGDKVPAQALHPSKKQTQRKIVKYHNYFRSIVEPPAANMLLMKWHKGAAKAAQRWANECMFLTHDNNTGRHVNDFGTCGQNIFVSTHTVPWLFAMRAWFSEKDDFTYGSEYNVLKVVGHYTQMVWAASHEVGCGFAKCFRNSGFSKKMYYNYVCNYCPIGNRELQVGYPYKTGPPCSSCKDTCLRKKLCKNSCQYADSWSNCRELYATWPDWLCRSDTLKGRDRLSHCRATCLCKGKIYD
ncbi:cysteine-rich secretory protein-related [Holotrichia oblita]|uniref:Cysteine-rich secretory protein-related n=1 Tax=Holotrichia oblita TaxID=644536 RepID=A0ACB9TBS0_HOLOL|nr:cysteine-rich secretory protein-related [Holotrichia oblita]